VTSPKIKEADHYLLQPGKGAELVGAGLFGALHPDIHLNYQFTRPVFFFEINLAALQKLLPGERRYQSLPKYPSVARDISMVVPAMVNNSAIIQLIKESGGPLVKEVFPFDKYQDSVAYRVVYQAVDKTLTEAEVNNKHQIIVHALVDKLLVKIR
jgi:phenylalanyl-tRNA synthetase beta chain